MKRFTVVFEELKIAEINTKANALLPFFFFPGNREVGHMKPDTVAFILGSEQSQLNQ